VVSVGWRWLLRVALALACCMAAGCGEGAPDGPEVRVVATSALRGLMEEELVPAFGRTSAGEDVRVEVAYGDSGREVRRLARAGPADLVIPATAPDIDALVSDGVVPRAWIQPYGDNVADTLVVFIRRAGGGEVGVRSWQDLASDGVEAIVADPRTSDAGAWAVLATYGAARGASLSDRRSRLAVRRVLSDAIIEPTPDDALDALESGAGDVLLGYESDAIAAQRDGMDLDYAIPDETLVVEHPIAVTRRGGRAARLLAAFLGTKRAQRTLAESGFRPAASGSQFESGDHPHAPRGVFTISSAGGWDFARSELLDERGLVARLLR
jgi:sulfate/thiosulfate transport system substrate-binding protein